MDRNAPRRSSRALGSKIGSKLGSIFCALGLIASDAQPNLAAPTDLSSELQAQGRRAAALRRTTKKKKATAEKSEGSDAPQVDDSIRNKERDIVKVLYAYEEEMERNLFARNWINLAEYVKIFNKQEEAFVSLIENSFPSSQEYDKQAAAALEYEAQIMFLQLDDLAEAAASKHVAKAEKAYVGLALAYDRFLKAGDLYDVYEDTDSSKLYDNFPQDMLVFDREAKPKVADEVLIVAGPDKGRLGLLIGVSDASGKGVVRVKYGRRSSTDPTFEIKVLDMKNLAKTIPEGKYNDAQLRDLLMCPGGMRLSTKGFDCRQ